MASSLAPCPTCGRLTGADTCAGCGTAVDRSQTAAAPPASPPPAAYPPAPGYGPAAIAMPPAMPPAYAAAPWQPAPWAATPPVAAAAAGSSALRRVLGLVAVQGVYSFVRAAGLLSVHDQALALGNPVAADYARLDAYLQIAIGIVSLVMAVGLYLRLPAAWYGTALVALIGVGAALHLMGGPYVGATSNLLLLVGRGLVLVLLLTPALRRQFGVRLPGFD